MHCSQFSWIQIQKAKNCGRDLGGLHGGVNFAGCECGIADKQRDVRVEILEAAVFGDGGTGRVGVDDAEFRFDDDVGCAGIHLWIGKKKAERSAGINAGNVRVGLVSAEDSDSFGSSGRIPEPEEEDIVAGAFGD